MTRMHAMFAFLLLCLTALSASASGQTIEAALNSQYGDKIMALRRPVEKNSQVYDATGKMLKGGSEGSWTLYGRLLVKKIQLKKDSIQIEGKRLVYVHGGGTLVPFATREKFKVQINFTSPPASTDEANALLGHVFALTDADVVQLAPHFWQNYLSDQLLHTALNTPKDPQVPAGERARRIKIVELEADGGIKPDSTFVEMRDGVARPRATFAPEPEYTDEARKERYQGTLVLSLVVDATGKVRAPNIIRPLGMGLDESAVKKVLTWRFDPGKVDGKPIATQMNIEVSFNLY